MLPPAIPPILYAPGRSNVNSLLSVRVAESGLDGEWLKQLGRTANVSACSARCVAWTPPPPPSSTATSATPPLRCRSFTHFAANYSHRGNASLAGACLGHVDPVWVPLRDASWSVSSGYVHWPCVTDDDCSLNGRCAAAGTAAGTCACAAGWTGTRCETLDVLPVTRPALGFNPMKNGKNMSSWGGSVHFLHGAWHMWAVQMTQHCGISTYLVNSAVVHAVSATGSVGGPYTESEGVLPPFAHEPDLCVAPTGELVLISVASTPLGDLNGHPSCVCVDGTTASAAPGTCDACNNSCHVSSPTLTVSASGNPEGPWTSTPIWLDGGENPSIWIMKNGSVLGMCRGGKPCAYAADWRNISSWVRAAPGPTSLSSSPDVEDPFIYQDENDHWHALIHSLEGAHMVGSVDDAQVGVHAFSRDGLMWTYTGTAYTNMVELADDGEGVLRLNRRERPHLVFKGDGSRTPVAVTNSAELGGAWGDRSFTLVQELRAGDKQEAAART